MAGECQVIPKQYLLRSADDIVSFADLDLEIHFLHPPLFFCIGIPCGTGGVGPGNMNTKPLRTTVPFHVRRGIQDFSGGRIGQREIRTRDTLGEGLLDYPLMEGSVCTPNSTSSFAITVHMGLR